MALSCALVQGCTWGTISARARPKPLVEFPVKIINGLPTLTVIVLGKPLNLFLDLGGFNEIALTSEELATIPVEFSGGTVSYRDSTGSVSESREFVVTNVKLGGVQVGPLEGAEFAFGRAGPPDKNGYIGIGFLKNFLLVLDYPESRVRLYTKGDEKALEMECGTRLFSVARVNGIAQTNASTDLGNLLFLWDTGSTDNVIRTSRVERTHLRPQTSDDGPPIVKLQRFTLARRNYGPSEFRAIAFKAPDVDAVLGTPFYRANRVCLDLSRGVGAIRKGS
jgi:hypothetical protein